MRAASRSSACCPRTGGAACSAAMMRAQLDDVRERGEPIAALWASEEAIYRRYGYGMAALGAELELARGYHGSAPGSRSRCPRAPRHARGGEGALPPIYERVRLRDAGHVRADGGLVGVARPATTRPTGARAGGVKNALLLELDGEPGRLRALPGASRSGRRAPNAGHVRVIEAMGDDAAEVELWRYLLGIDWVATLTAQHLPIDHPLLHQLVYPRRALLRIYDTLFVRLVDVGAALSARPYARRRAARARARGRVPARERRPLADRRRAAPSGRRTRPTSRSTSTRRRRSTSAASAPPSSSAPGSCASCGKAPPRAPTGSSRRPASRGVRRFFSARRSSSAIAGASAAPRAPRSRPGPPCTPPPGCADAEQR